MKISLRFTFGAVCKKTLSGALQCLNRWRRGRDSYHDAYLLLMQLFLRQGKKYGFVGNLFPFPGMEKE